MKVLFLHCNNIKFKATKKALKSVEDVSLDEKEVKDCLACFTAVEKRDEKNPSKIIEEFINNIKDIASQVKAKNIVLYPYAHLSSSLSSPSTAIEVLENTKKKLSKDFKVESAPFGWYKEFSVHVKGHPLSELSREILIDEKETSEEKSILKYKELSEKERVQKLARIGKHASLDKEKLDENDHRILGSKLDLFSFQEISPGSVFFHPKGMIIKNELTNFLRKERTKRNYKEIQTPVLLNDAVWQISGHMKLYSENMFFTEIDGKNYGLKPMNCPGAIITYKTNMRSYKDLPLKLAEFGNVNRNELSGVLAGLFRMRTFTQDDVHVFITKNQIEKEASDIIELIDHFYNKVFGFKYHVELSTRPKKYMGDLKIWDMAEKTLENVMKKKKLNYKINKGDGAFYGPKIDFHIKDSLGRTWQLATVQLDFQMPESFDLEYTNEKGEKQRPLIIHNVIYGSLERFIGILIEHFKGRFPLWLSPVQIKVLNFTERNIEYAKKIESKLIKEGLRVESDYRSETVEHKIRDSQLEKIPYTLVLGDKEEENKTIAVRDSKGKVKYKIKLEDFIKEVSKEIEDKI